MENPWNTNMTNEEVLKALPRRMFAELLIKTVTRPEYDEDLDGEIRECGSSDFYVTSDGMEYWEDYESALQHECWWLAQVATFCGIKE